ncbi:helix-turn-helix domain-containing protein [Solirubrobacter taibaiensis]|nr:helix-turn-helix domain-containing protein [Solirubrobacter taibaiensis]
MARKLSLNSLPTVGGFIAEQSNEDGEFRAEWQRLAFARHVAAELIRYRADNGLSQSDLARALDLSQPRVAKLESGEFNPRIETIIEITRKTGVEFAFSSALATAEPKLLTKAAKEQVAVEYDNVVVHVASASRSSQRTIRKGAAAS